jgi:hypothetical protein
MSVASKSDIPSHWIKGQLLNLQRFEGGTYRATLLGDNDDPEKGYVAPAITFDSSYAAQQFVSEWYQPAQRQRSG